MAKKYIYQDIPYFENFRQMLSMAVDSGNTAFKFRENGKIREVSYKEFKDTTIYLGTELYDMGYLSSHVACIGPNSYKWIVIYMTMLNSNGVFVPIDKELPFCDIVNVLNHGDVKVLFYSEKYKEELMANLDKFPNVEKLICTDDLEFEEMIVKGKLKYEIGNAGYEKSVGDMDVLRVLVYTSGTTGMPKGVMLSERNIASCIYHGMRTTKLYGSCLSVLPYHHTYEMCGFLASMNKHATICINENLKTVLKNLKVYSPEYIFLVPAFLEKFYKKIVAVGGKKLVIALKVSNALRKVGIDLRGTLFKTVHKTFGGNLKKIVSGGAALRSEISKFFNDIGITLVNGYGITECSPLVCMSREGFNDYDNVGLPIPCLKIKIADADSNGIGEVSVKSPSVMMGYYKDEERTNEVLIDGWYHTGDYGYLDAENRLHITGRKKNMIPLNSGKNVFPEEIENYILLIDYVAEVVVRAVTDDAGIATGLYAEVFLGEGAPENDAKSQLMKDIKAVLKELPAYKQVSRVEIRDTEFVKTTTNKIKR